MSYAASEGVRDRPTGRAAIFVDYEDIFRTLSHTTGNGEVGALISEMIEALKKSLLEERQTQTAVSHAYADFTELNGKGDTLQRALYLQGVESRFVPQSLQANAVEIQLCVDAMDLLHHRADIDTFVLLTGSRSYLPLIQHVKRYGHRVLIVALEEPPLLDQVHHVDGGWFFDARDLLSASGQRVLTRTDRTRTDRTKADRTPSKPSGSVARSPFPFKSIEDPILIQALEIIEEHFGQYEEVYLTPLLRKMSEMLDEHSYDPKEIISDLEDSQAVRLEKRQGFPHDYTVLIVERDHPDVERVQQELSDRSPYYFDDVRSSYDEDEAVLNASVDGRAGDGRADDHQNDFDDFDGEFDVDVEVDVDFEKDGYKPELEEDTFNDGVRESSRRR